MNTIRTNRWLIALLAVPALAASAAQAATAPATPVYRCSADGGTVYTAQPCAGGVTVAALDRRDAAQQAEARATVQRDLALARQMREQRLQREAETGSAVAGGIRHTPPVLSTSAGETTPGGLGSCSRGRNAASHHGRKATAACSGHTADPRVSFEIRAPKERKAEKPPKMSKAAQAGGTGGRSARVGRHGADGAKGRQAAVKA